MSARSRVPALHELVAARVCHDLVSPLGAVGNGLELLALAGDAGNGTETALIAESAALAGARLKLLRLAFGPASEGQTMAAREIAATVAALAPALRLTVAWQAAGDLPQAEIRCACLALMCLGAALVRDGAATVDRSVAGNWRIDGQASRTTALPDLWDLAAGKVPPPTGLAARQVQFAILPLALASEGRQLMVTQGPDRLALVF